ncbi:MAG TPA: CHRD domain-containing protein [Casimicrobiaceae bacterium]|nr:CHRD domain-containing protein [Casimicrobiaceae bacterium]
MNTKIYKKKWITALALAAAVSLAASCQTMSMGGSEQVSLTGANEVPPVQTSAAGSGTVTIKDDRSVSVKITVTGMTPTAAHIHEAAAGQNGPVIVPFTKTSDTTFEAPANAKLTEAQYASYKAGKLYVNVHSAQNPGGEIRAQLKGS